MNIPGTVRKIAVLRALGLGDFLATLPALNALRETFPQAELVYLGKPWLRGFLEGRPGPVDRVIEVPVSRGVRIEPSRPDLVEDPQELAAFFARMQQEQFDLAIQMHGGGRNSNPFVRRLGARLAIGLKTPDAPELDRWMPYTFYQHEVMRLLELVSLVGATTCDTEPHIPVTAEDQAELERSLPELRPPFIVFHPGSTDVRRRWPPERFLGVGDALAAQGFQIVVTGVDYERELTARVVEGMRAPAVNAGERLSVGGLAALLARAALVISNDTGPMHLANAVGAPNVAIFWCGNALNWSHFGRRFHRPLISWSVTCPLCGTEMTTEVRPDTTCPHDICFVEGVSVSAVLEAAADLLAYQQRFPEGAPAGR